MANYSYLVVIGVCVFCFGLCILLLGLFGAKDKLLLAINSAKLSQKNEIPIIPRNQRDSLVATNLQIRSDDVRLASDDSDDDVLQTEPSQPAVSNQQNNLEDDMPIEEELVKETKETLVVDEELDVASVKSDIFNIEIPPMGHSDRFNGEASMVDECLRHQDSEVNENNQVLFDQKQTLTLVISPRSGELISGSKIISIAREYGMKYGVLNMFHRYENPEGVGMLWFSMLGVSVDGVKGFDLLDLPQMTYRGLVLFLALPHPQAVRGFDSMVQVAKTIAIEMDADIHDESDYIIDDKKFAQMRHYAAEYKG